MWSGIECVQASKEWGWFSSSLHQLGPKQAFSRKVEEVVPSLIGPVPGLSAPGYLTSSCALLCCSARPLALSQDSETTQTHALMFTHWLSCGATTYLLLMTPQNTPTGLGSTGSTVSGQALSVTQVLHEGAGIPPRTAFYYLTSGVQNMYSGSNLSTLLLRFFSTPVPHPKADDFLIAVSMSPGRVWAGDKAVSSTLVLPCRGEAGTVDFCFR